MPAKLHKRSKIAKKIVKEPARDRGSDVSQAEIPFHMGVLPTQFNLAQSELERASGKKRRKEW